ncbi:MAG: PQQ-binding-like beta-propeller repeat protein [Candidatus Nitrohelix vancouverensis]|uniref:PQQ-binding-like beta-propeller repeat protein n=1 Tax=Candidatus Nitrohelix vancouverensis TaxID=2705534 RepID=A0A7T0G3D6_9BACT|nr:MAG: PQQ-binding-like beta-propeller repeat protein [Candidatus Nitrohelix vancouverensis]
MSAAVGERASDHSNEGYRAEQERKRKANVGPGESDGFWEETKAELFGGLESELGLAQDGRVIMMQMLLYASALLFLIVGPFYLLIMILNHYQWVLKEESCRRVSLCCLAGILGLSFMEGGKVLTQVYLPEFSFCNGTWKALDVEYGEKSSTLLQYYNYAPGRAAFFYLIFRALEWYGISKTDPVYTEIAYRVVQFLIITGGNVLLYFFLVKILKKARLPGAWFLPLISVALLSLHPEFVFTNLSVQPHTSLFFTIFIALIWVSYRLAFEDQGWKTMLMFASIGAVAILWRNELKLVPFIFLLLCCANLREWKRAVKIFTVTAMLTSVLPLSVMTYNYERHGQFALHTASQMAIRPLESIGQGLPDESYGLFWDDGYISRFELRLSEDRFPEIAGSYPYLLKFYYNYIVNHPKDFFMSWANRVPMNLFVLPSQLHESQGACEGIYKRVDDYIRPLHKLHLWLILCAALLFLPFALFKERRGMPFVMIPALYGLGVVGVAGSMEGYFVYVYLSFAVILVVGMASVLRVCQQNYSRIIFPVSTTSRSAFEANPGDAPSGLFRVSTLLLGLCLGGVMYLGVTGFSFRDMRYESPQAINIQDRLERIYRGNHYSGKVRIKWLHTPPYYTLPYIAGHFYKTKIGLLYNSYSNHEMRVVTPESGEGLKAMKLKHKSGGPGGHFLVHGEKLFVSEMETHSQQEFRVIEFEKGKVLAAGKLKYPIYSKFIVDENAVYYATYVGRKYHIASQPLPGSRAKPTTPAEYDWIFDEAAALSSVAQTADAIYFGSMHEGYFYSLDKKTGNVIWKFQGQASAFSTPIIDGETIVYADRIGRVYQLDRRTGRLLSEVDTSSMVFEGLSLDGSQAYTVSYDNLISSVDLTQKKMLWQIKGHGAMRVPPLVQEKSLYVSSGTWLMKLDRATGGILWEINLGTFILDTPMVSGDSVFVRSIYGVYGLNEFS